MDSSSEANASNVIRLYFVSVAVASCIPYKSENCCCTLSFGSVHDKKICHAREGGNPFWVWHDQKPIKIKKHRKPAISLFRYGLDFLCDSIVLLAYKTIHFQQALKILTPISLSPVGS